MSRLKVGKLIFNVLNSIKNLVLPEVKRGVGTEVYLEEVKAVEKGRERERGLEKLPEDVRKVIYQILGVAPYIPREWLLELAKEVKLEYLKKLIDNPPPRDLVEEYSKRGDWKTYMKSYLLYISLQDVLTRGEFDMFTDYLRGILERMGEPFPGPPDAIARSLKFVYNWQKAYGGKYIEEKWERRRPKLDELWRSIMGTSLPPTIFAHVELVEKVFFHALTDEILSKKPWLRYTAI